jgi:hypothetical protein
MLNTIKFRLCLTEFRPFLSEFIVFCQKLTSILSSPLKKMSFRTKNYIHRAVNSAEFGRAEPNGWDALSLGTRDDMEPSPFHDTDQSFQLTPCLYIVPFLKTPVFINDFFLLMPYRAGRDVHGPIRSRGPRHAPNRAEGIHTGPGPRRARE